MLRSEAEATNAPQPRAPARRLMRACLFVGIGVVFTYGSGWFASASSSGDCHLDPGRVVHCNDASVEIASWLGVEPVAVCDELYSVTATRSGVLCQTATYTGIELGNGEPVSVMVLECGWPARALRGVWIVTADDEGNTVELHRGAIVVPERVMNVLPPMLHFLPVAPAWPGFLVDTMVYAVTCWLLFVAPRRTRAIIRRRRGRCVRCGYPLGESAWCSECGSNRR